MGSMVRVLYNKSNRWLSRTTLGMARTIISFFTMANKSRNIHMGIFKGHIMINSFTTYKKALKVVDSCENHTQLDGAKNYINNFFKFYSVNTKDVFTADDSIHRMYQRLLIKHAEKSVLLEI
jgi:hypothetical protein